MGPAACTDVIIAPVRLLGRWVLSRTIHDHRSDTVGLATGRADFTAQDDRVDWTEHGRLQMDGHDGPFRRRLQLVVDLGSADPDPDPDATVTDRPDDHDRHWTVLFEDGRPLHPWRAGPMSHRCDPDLYEGEIILGSCGWTLRWSVLGPHKDYTMISEYRRPLAAPERSGAERSGATRS